VDRDVDQGKSLAAAVGASIVVESFEMALERHGADFDSVVIHAPTDQRRELVRLAAVAKKHILVDSPIANSRRDAETTIKACEHAGVSLAFGQTLRFAPSNQVMMDRLASGKLGDPGLLRVHRWCGCDQGQGSTLPETVFGYVDLAIWVFGARPLDLYAIERRLDNEASAPDYVQIHFSFPSGGMAVLDFSAALPPGGGYEAVSLIGSTGAAFVDDHHNSHLLYRGGDPLALISERGHRHIVDELQAFIDSITEPTRTSMGGSDYILVHQVIEAIDRSLESGQVLRSQGGNYEPV
jgi:predicted dehydrogenase